MTTEPRKLRTGIEKVTKVTTRGRRFRGDQGTLFGANREGNTRENCVQMYVIVSAMIVCRETRDFRLKVNLGYRSISIDFVTFEVL